MIPFLVRFLVYHTRSNLKEQRKEVKSGMCEYLGSFYTFWGEFGELLTTLELNNPKNPVVRKESDSLALGVLFFLKSDYRTCKDNTVNCKVVVN